MNDFEKHQNTWLNWGIELHFCDDQLKRQESAISKKLTPLIIIDGIGCFKGSKKDYTTSLLGCSCVDFNMRKKPCKHMYRLAYELNVFMLRTEAISDFKISNKIRIDEAMKIIETLTDDQQKIFKNIAFICGNEGNSNGVLLEDNVENTKKFFELKLIKKVTDTYKILHMTNISTIRKCIPKNPEIKLPRKKVDLINYILLNFPNIIIPNNEGYVHIELDDSIENLGLSIHKRLCAKFPSECYYNFD